MMSMSPKGVLLAMYQTIISSSVLRFLFPILVYGLFLAVIYLYDYDLFIKTTILVGTYVFTPMGLEIAVPLGIFTLKLKPLQVFFSLIFTDVIVATFIMWNLPILKKVPGLGKILMIIEEKGKKSFEKSKKLAGTTFAGLILFVAIPIQGTGAISGSILGTLIGFPQHLTLIAVTFGTSLRLAVYLMTILGILHIVF